MNRSLLKAWVVTSGILSVWLCVPPIAAQVVPDNTLPLGERSQVSGNPNVQIDGGARRGGNLFHSFSQFSIPTGGSAYFNNAADVRNIFSRVTGGSISNIDGLIRANGMANLFLLNPNGILFGRNASLNIGGSFVASTANRINFADRFQYSATNPQTTPLLTISAPVGLQMGTNPGRIAVLGNGYNLSVTTPFFTPLIRGNSQTGLKVAAGQTLALIGGAIEIQGGVLTSEQGRIELSSVRDGEVNLNAGFTFSYPKVQNFDNIRLSQQALADASGGGVIRVQGNQISLADSSLLLIDNQGNQAGGSIRVSASQSLELSGVSPDGRIFGGLNSLTEGVGIGADIAVSTRNLAIRDGAKITTDSHGSARAGNVTMQVFDSIQITGFSSITPSLTSAISTNAFSSGNAGSITVSAQNITLLNGGGITAPTFGIGQGGNITVNALNSITLIGANTIFIPSAIAATSLGAGDAGQVTVNTSRLALQDAASITTSTLSTGNAGNITINAKNVEISGRVPGSANPSAVRSAATIASPILRQTFRLPPAPSGNSGNVTINTESLSVTDGAIVEVRNAGVGNAGTLRISANSIVLDTRGALTGTTAFGEGGNLDLNVRDFLLLRNNSQITTSAGGRGDGGNIRIDTGSIAAIPNENSDIRADSVNARGGNISINASGIFGIQFRPQDTPLSDITATGANSASNGTVQLNIEQSNPTSGLVELPTAVVDPSRLIAQGCPATQGNSFVISGRGGLPPSPEQQLDDDADWQDRRRLTVAQQTALPTPAPFVDTRTALTSHPQILEATGWQTTSTGNIELVATTPDSIVPNRLNPLTSCQVRQ